MNTKENVKNAFGVDDRKKEESKPMAQIIIPSTEFPSNVRARVESMSDPEVRKRRKAWMDETDPELKERKEQEMWDYLNMLGKELDAQDEEQNTMRKLFTSESVTEGHPDKIADQISDAVLDAILAEDPNGRVACETVVTTDLIHIVGEISTTSSVNIPQIARDTVLGIGYDRAEYGFDGSTCKVLVNIDEQSPDIARGIDVPWKITDKICSRTDKVKRRIIAFRSSTTF